MFVNQHTHLPAARQVRMAQRIAIHRLHAADRIAAAQAKRERKAAKRAALLSAPTVR